MFQDLLSTMRVVALPTKTNFRGITVREVALFKGEYGWGEFSPFLEYDDLESSLWLQSAIEAATEPRPLALLTRHVLSTKDAFSGVAPITVTPEGQNQIVIVSGANNLLTNAEIDAARIDISESAYLVCQLEIDLKLTLKALQVAKEVGTPTILNPAPAVESLPKEIYELTDIFCPNETETQILTGMKIDSVASAELAAKELLSRGIKTVLITLGENGCLIVDANSATHIPADKVKVVDTTGAGDSFVGALAHFLALGLTLEDSATRAVKVASISVGAKGTQSSFPDRKDIPESIFSGLDNN